MEQQITSLDWCFCWWIKQYIHQDWNTNTNTNPSIGYIIDRFCVDELNNTYTNTETALLIQRKSVNSVLTAEHTSCCVMMNLHAQRDWASHHYHRHTNFTRMSLFLSTDMHLVRLHVSQQSHQHPLVPLRVKKRPTADELRPFGIVPAAQGEDKVMTRVA